MDVSALNDLQGRLEAHFSSIAKSRERSGFPVFALEHGLNEVELKQLNDALRSRRVGGPSSPHWLLWVVYATEAGYGYKGDEYWPSFREQTPNWEHQDNPKVKSWFRKFQKSFNGVEPSGPWAEQFRIIAWPITNALLPRYLQDQFARLLYDLRFRLASTSLYTGSIGQLLAAHASHASTRFQAFLEQEELTGQIVAALLQQESVEDDQLIHRATLDRVVSDLEDVRASRKWLKETRRVVSDRFKGIGRGTYRPPSPTTTGSTDEPATPDTSRFAIRPDLYLRSTGAEKWSALVSFKSLRPIAAESNELRVFLDRTRCRLNGSDDWKPTGWLLSGNRQGALKRWPDEHVPLIHFEQANPLMALILQSDFRLTQGPVWLFRIGSDGIARHIHSPTVRPDKDYLVVSVGDLPSDMPGLTQCVLDCQGVRAGRLAVPSQVSAEVTQRFRELGIEVARTIRVWPAGLPGRGWDGDGSTEWLTTESPCFGVAPDHPLGSLSFRLDDGSEEVVATEASGEPTFVRLPPLSAGHHLLTVEAHRSPDLEHAVTTPPAKGFAKLAVREPEPWTPGVASHPGLIVTCDPFDASLDDLWRNELDLSVAGPEGFAVRARLTLHAADGRMVLSETVNDSMDIPIIPEAWHRTFDRFLNDRTRAWKYLEAASCTLEINGDSLGICTLRFDHDPSPLRWALARRQQRTFVHLVDDTGLHNSAPDAQFFSMDHPLVGITLDVETARSEQAVPSPGGLYRAAHAQFNDAAVVSVPPAGLQGLGVAPAVQVGSGTAAIQQAVGLLRLWYSARHAGFLVNVRRAQVTRCIFDAIFKSICGENWQRADLAFVQQPTSANTLQALIDLVDRRTPFGHRLAQHRDDGEDAVAAVFADEAGRLHVSQDRYLCHFALQFANRQRGVLADPQLDDGIEQLVNNPVLLRGARLATLLHSEGGGP